MVNDISRAFFHAKAKREVDVQLPKEGIGINEGQMCGKLKFSMYGTRDVAQNLFHECSCQLVEIGFKQGMASPCLFYHPERNIRTYVHGDDYVSAGKARKFNWMKNQLESRYIVKTQVLGPGRDHQRQIKVCNRILTWNEATGIEYEADPRHIEITFKQLQMNDAKAVTTVGTKEEGRTNEDHSVPLSEKEATNYRAITARCNHLALDRPDLAFAVKYLARAMAKPTRGDLHKLKRLARYLRGKPRMVLQYYWQTMPSTVTPFSDADLAGCRETRRSTTGGCIKIGTHSIKGWSKTQVLIALSSGESELYASPKVAAETLGILSMLKDLRWKMHGEVYGDANAALGIINRNGFGKYRHIDTGLLWIQQVAADKRLKFGKAFGTNNPADLFTKYLDEKTRLHHTTNLGYRVTEGRPDDAPQLQTISISLDDYQISGNTRQNEAQQRQIQR